MKSIRRRLLQRLLIGMVLIASGTGVLLYQHVRSELDELYNAHLHQVALFMANEWEHTDHSTLNATFAQSPTKDRWGEEDYLAQLWRRDGVLLAQQVPATTGAKIPLNPKEGLFRKRLINQSWRVYRLDRSNVILQIAQPEFARTNTIQETSVQLMTPLVLQVPLLILVAWLSVRKGLKPLQTLSHAISQRKPEALTPIDYADQPQELQPLVTTLNELLARLGAALEQQRQFVADAAHELRTPLSVLQLQLDVLQRVESDDERDQAIVQLRAGLQRTTHLAQQLLSIARAEGGSQNVTTDSVDIASSIEIVLERYLPLARARDLDCGVTRLEPLTVHCARADMETIVDNLVSNAIRYTPCGGRIDIAAYREMNNAVIDIADSGPGIPLPKQARVFDRFYRVLHSGTDVVEGSGLGLAIVKAICDRYGADIQISNGDNGCGARFTVRWPLHIVKST